MPITKEEARTLDPGTELTYTATIRDIHRTISMPFSIALAFNRVIGIEFCGPYDFDTGNVHN